jgi:hypothetical protein
MAEKLSTADCQKYLAQTKGAERQADYESDKKRGMTDPDELAYAKELADSASNPKKWKRMTKYLVGSDIDKGEKDCAPGGYGGMDYARHIPAGGIVRTFYLEGTDHITYNLVEVDGKIVYEDDCSD